MKTIQLELLLLAVTCQRFTRPFYRT